MSDSLVDLAIVGGGATGLAAAIQAASDGLRAVLLERGLPGGSIRERARVEVVAGLPVGPTGRQFTDQAVATATRLGAELRPATEAVALAAGGGAHRLHLADGAALEARAVVVATGTSRPAAMPRGVREFTGRGVYFGVPRALPEVLREREAFVAGEVRVAAPAVARLADHGARVTLLSAGSPSPGRRGARDRDRRPAAAAVRELPGTEVVEAVGVERLEALILRDVRSGRTSVRNAAALFLLGFDRPRTGWLAGALALDADGYVLTGPACLERGGDACCRFLPRVPLPLETSVPGVFAAGGVRGARDCCAESLGADGLAAVRHAAWFLRQLAPAGVARAADPPPAAPR